MESTYHFIETFLFPMSTGVSKRVSERTNERDRARERNEWCERTEEQMAHFDFICVLPNVC